jgi:hypothetical protein
MDRLEQDVLDKFVAGDDSILEILRRQVLVAHRRSREITGVGFFSCFDVPAHAPRLPGCPSIAMSDVWAEIDGLEYGAGFVLFVDNGVLAKLEGTTCEGAWPRTFSAYSVYYTNKKERDLAALRASPGWPRSDER